MKAIFEVEELVHDWSPPFDKRVTTEEFGIEVGEQFSRMNSNGEFVFKLIKLERNRALIEYNPLFTLKQYENPRNKRIWIGVGKDKSFTFLWGNKGATKRLFLRRIEGNKNEPQTGNNC